MNNPFSFGKSQPNNRSIFGLFMSNSALTGCLFEVNGKHVEATMRIHHPLDQGWDHYIEDIDDMLAQLEEEKRVHVKEVIFFVYSSFIDPDTQQIERKYIDSMKKISRELELKPLGYIECQQAISSHVNSKEQSLLHALFVEVDKDSISTTMYKGERIVQRDRCNRTATLASDMLQLFQHIHEKTMLPSRLMFYSPSAEEKEIETLRGHHWPPELFIQTPRLEEVSIKILEQSAMQLFEMQLLEEKEMKKEEPAPSPILNATAVVKPNSQRRWEQTNPMTEPPVDGFVIGKDVTQTTKKKSFIPTFPNISLPKFTVVLPSFISGLFKKKASIPNTTVQSKRIYLIPLFGILCILIALFLLLYFFHSATVTVFVPTIQLNKSLVIDSASGALEIQVSTSSAAITASVPTTGSRDIGEKAKGDVTLYNRSFSSQVITTGAIVKSDGKSYVATKDVTVPAASEGSDFSTQPGKITLSVTASAIGLDSNIDKGKRFIIGTFDETTLFGINDAALTGGTKKTLRTVSAKDLENAKAKAAEAAKVQQFSEDGISNNPSARVIPQLTTVNLKNSTFSKSIGDEANDISLQANVLRTQFWYDEQKIKQNILNQLQAEVPNQYSLPPDRMTYSISDVKQKNSLFSVTVHITASPIRVIDIVALGKRIPGKNIDSIQPILQKEFSVTGIETHVKSPIFFLNSVLPFFSSHILITTQSLPSQ